MSTNFRIQVFAEVLNVAALLESALLTVADKKKLPLHLRLACKRYEKNVY